MLDRLTERGVRWRSLGALFLAGGALALLSLLLPLSPGAWRGGVAILGLTALVSGTAMIAGASRLPIALMSPSLAFGTVLITFGVIWNGQSASPYALLYVWVGFEAFFFLSRRTAMAHLAFVGVAYALALNAAGGGHADDAARTDPLTGLLNRRGFEERLGRELERAHRTDGKVSLLVADLDHFKLVNDRHGHRAGDDTLQQFAASATRTKRAMDDMAASAARSSRSCCPTPTSTARSCWPSGSGARRATRSTSPVGKIGVPDPVLRKPGPLSGAEWAEMRKHPELGARILSSANLDDLAGWVLAHRAARFAEEAVAELERGAGTQFDRAVVEAFLACEPTGGPSLPTARA